MVSEMRRLDGLGQVVAVAWVEDLPCASRAPVLVGGGGD